jgi:uncharacterized membrane protein
MNTTYLPALGRLLIAAIFLMSGVGKLGDPGMTQGYIASAGMPLPLVSYILAVLIEIGGGVLLLVGYRTRLVALVLAVFTEELRHRGRPAPGRGLRRRRLQPRQPPLIAAGTSSLYEERP